MDDGVVAVEVDPLMRRDTDAGEMLDADFPQNVEDLLLGNEARPSPLEPVRGAFGDGDVEAGAAEENGGEQAPHRPADDKNARTHGLVPQRVQLMKSTRPPSTRSAAPVVADARGEAR